MKSLNLSRATKRFALLISAALSGFAATHAQSTMIPNLVPGSILKYELSADGRVEEILPLLVIGQRGPWKIFQGRDLNDEIFFYAEAAYGLIFSDCVEAGVPSDAEIRAFSTEITSWPVGEILKIPSATGTESVTVSPQGEVTATGISKLPIPSRKLTMHTQYVEGQTVYVVPAIGDYVLTIDWPDGSSDKLIEIVPPDESFGPVPDEATLKEVCPTIFGTQ